jgi:hypothetical protein
VPEIAAAAPRSSKCATSPRSIGWGKFVARALVLEFRQPRCAAIAGPRLRITRHASDFARAPEIAVSHLEAKGSDAFWCILVYS